MAKKDRASGAVQTSALTVSGSVLIKAPFRPIETNEYVCRHVTVRLTRLAAEALKVIFNGLYEGHRTLSNGRHIDTAAHAVCWLLENIEPGATSASIPMVLIRAPLGRKVASEHVCRIVDARLTRPAAEALKGIFKGLYEGHKTLSNGRHIDSPVHAVCWLLENAEMPKGSNFSMAS